MKAIGMWFGRIDWIPFGIRYRLLNYLFPPQRQEASEILFANKFGHKFHLNLQSYIDWNIYFFGAYEAYLLKLLSSLSRRIDDCIFADIGANIGLHAIHLSGTCKHVYAFEPVPYIVEKIEKNIRLNQIDNIEVLKFGLGESPAQMPFMLPPVSNLGSGYFTSAMEEGTIALPIEKGDDFFATRQILPHLIKIDVEGHEKEVLAGMQQTLALARPIIILEYYETTREKIRKAGGFKNLLPSGYQILGIQSLNNIQFALRPFEEGVSEFGDILCFPEERRSIIPLS